MSTGATFNIINNEGKQDKLLMATDFLHNRINGIKQFKASRGLSGADVNPTLLEIEKTHVLFMNAHFKPFVACAFEYNKVAPTSGTVTLSSTVTFNLPNFGDFLSDMALHLRLGAVTADAAKPLRWCAYPGEQLLTTTRFMVHSNPLDEYKTDAYQFKRKFMMPGDKLNGYKKCAGQQLEQDCELVPGLTNCFGGIAVDRGLLGSSVAYIGGVSSLHMKVTNGYQTLKVLASHASTGVTGAAGTAWNHQRTDILEVVMPTLFWFNEDVRLALAAVSIPSGQRFVEFELCALSSLVRGVAFADSATTAGTLTAAGSITISGTEITHCKLYVNNIFVDPEVHDIYIMTVGFNMIRVHKRHTVSVSSCSNGDVLLTQLKWPVETIYFGFKKTSQTTPANSLEYLDGYEMFADVKPVRTTFYLPAQDTQVDTPDAVQESSVMSVQWNSVAPVVQHVSFQAHGIPLFNEIPAVMYNSYFPLVYGSDNKVCTPSDPGVYAVFFNLYPGSYQPSGHINVSRAREFHILFDDTVQVGMRNLGTPVSSTYSALLVCLAVAINFLLISDGSAILRYST